MELSAAHIKAVETQTDLQAVAKQHRSFAKLQKAYGEHTFFLNNQGLFVFNRENDSDKEAHLLAYAKWSENKKHNLQTLKKPQRAGIVFNLHSGRVNNADASADA